MKPAVKIILTIVGVTGLSLLFFSFKPKNTKEDSSDSSDSSDDSSSLKATNGQFDSLVDIATKAKSDLFQNATGAKLEQMRKAFTNNLTGKEASTLITLAGRSESSWKASDKINFVTLLKKWQGNKPATTPPVTNTNTQNQTVHTPTPTTTTTTSYNPETDSDYLNKMLILGKWYDHIVKVNKARLIPRVIPSKNKLASQFLPWALADLKTWTDLVYKGEKNRDFKDQSIMDKLYKKYPKSFVGNNKIYNNFSGENNIPVMLSNKTNWLF